MAGKSFPLCAMWKPLEQIGVLDPTSAAKNYSAKQRTERRLSEGRRAGKDVDYRTHAPSDESVSDSFYINSGSCVHPYQITCLELEGDEISLVKWYMDKEKMEICMWRGDCCSGGWRRN